jgi:hypothetical protein
MPLGGANADYMDDYMGDGIGENIGALADSIFGLGRKPRRKTVRQKRGGFNVADLAPLALAFL